MRPVAAALLAVALLAPATAFACGMPVRVVQKADLADLMAEIDEVEEADADVDPADEAAVADAEAAPEEEPQPVTAPQAVEPAPAS